MKKIIGGGLLCIVSVILFLTAHNNAVKVIPDMTSWLIEVGKYKTALEETGGIVIFKWSIRLLLLSILIILVGCFEDDIRYVVKKLKRRYRI